MLVVPSPDPFIKSCRPRDLILMQNPDPVNPIDMYSVKARDTTQDAVFQQRVLQLPRL